MITDFLETTRDKSELRTALEVLREFKSNESEEEYLSIMFSAWVKLEQLEEFLDYLVNGTELQEDTIKYRESKMSNDYRPEIKKRRSKTARISTNHNVKIDLFPTPDGNKILVIHSNSGSIWLDKESAYAFNHELQQKISEM